MKKLLLVILLFASSAHAGLLTGQTPSSYSIPDGWSLVRTQDFESGCGANEDCELWGTGFQTSQKHGGTYSLGGTYASSQADVSWRLYEIGSFSEVYMSFYEYIEPQALFNDEIFLAKYWAGPQEILVDWFWAYNPPEENSFNGTHAYLGAVSQGDESQGALSEFNGIYRGPVPKGTWVQWEIHYRPNTPGNNDGFILIYKDGDLFGHRENMNLNGTVNMNNANVQVGGTYSKGVWMDDYPTCSPPEGCSTHPGSSDMCTLLVNTEEWYANVFSDPICNPIDPPLPSFKRFFDDVIIMTMGGTSGGDVSPPYTNTNSPAKNSTGWPVASRTVSFYVRDDTNVVRSTIGMTIDGTTVTPTITPTGATATSYLVSYTRGSNWAVDTEYTVGVTAQDVYSRQLTESYTFRTAAASPEALAVTTTTLANGKVGVPFIPPDLAATGGVSPYTWDNQTVLPAGLTIPSSGTGTWGVPTATFSGTITIRATDSATPTPATDNQDISFTVDAADIPGYPTIEIGTVADTFMGAGSTQNFSTGDELYVYTWPTSVTANRILMKWDLSSVSGTVPTTAILRLYMTGYDGTGGDNTYTINARRITGVNPTVSTASWAYYNGTNSWTGGSDGGLADAGAVEATVAVTKTPQYINLDVTAMVKDWLLTPSSNKGMLIGPQAASQDSNRHFGAYDNPTAAYRPVLFLTYVPTPSPNESLTGGILTGGVIQ